MFIHKNTNINDTALKTLPVIFFFYSQFIIHFHIFGGKYKICCSELHQMSVWTIGVNFQHLSVSVRPVFHRNFSFALSWSRVQFFLTQGNKSFKEPQPVLFSDVVVILHSSAFSFPPQRGLRDDQHAAGKLQHRHQLPRVSFTQTQVQQRWYWRETRTLGLDLGVHRHLLLNGT